MNQQNLQKGDKVQFEVRGKGLIQGTFSHTTPSGVAYIHGDDKKSYERVFDKVMKVGSATTDFTVAGQPPAMDKRTQINNKFDINKRFKFLDSLVRMVIDGKRVSLIITGPGGLGKTYTVMRAVERRLQPTEYKVVKGFSTAKGLYETLYEHNGKLIIFDDTDEVLKNDIAKNILKGALDSYDTRIVNWVTSSTHASSPAEFEFTGRIIFISNLSKDKIDQPILSRATNVDLTMSIQDKLERMKKILFQDNFRKGATDEEKQDAFDLIEKHAEVFPSLNFRTLLEVLDFRMSGEEEWEDLATYTIYNS